MKNFTCDTCGSNKFIKKSKSYICDYCGATLIEKKPYPKKRIYLIIALLVLLIVIGFFIYNLLYSIKTDVAKLATSDVQKPQYEKPSQAPKDDIFVDETQTNPFSDLILKSEMGFSKNNHENSLESSIKEYHKLEKNKAFYLALDKDGTYAFGRAWSAKTVQKAEAKALKECKKAKKIKNIKDNCIPLAINDKVSRFVIDEL